MTHPLRLGINIDHVATLRNARGGAHPDPIRAALLAMQAGADGITAHLREDRRHVRDSDIARLNNEVALPLNFEMAATVEMQAIALAVRPHAVCLVPEKREERTTEGGLEVVKQMAALKSYIAPLVAAGIRVSLFIAPDAAQVRAAAAIGAQVVELHTGHYAELCSATLHHSSPCKGEAGRGTYGHDSISAHPYPNLPPEGEEMEAEIIALQKAASYGASLGLEIHAGHGLTFENVGAVAAITEIRELNIGHFLVGEAVFMGLEQAIHQMRRAMDAAR